MTNTVPMIDLARAGSRDIEFDANARQIDGAKQRPRTHPWHRDSC
ncbi:hypothetical protein [Gordonia aichiensis]|nr:hypothetical protein [Gordonia aichiensis]